MSSTIEALHITFTNEQTRKAADARLVPKPQAKIASRGQWRTMVANGLNADIREIGKGSITKLLQSNWVSGVEY